MIIGHYFYELNVIEKANKTWILVGHFNWCISPKPKQSITQGHRDET